MVRRHYVVIDLRNGKYALGCDSEVPGVDYVLHLGGMEFQHARMTADKLNKDGHAPEHDQRMQHSHD